MTIYDKIGNVTLYVLLSIAGWWFGTFFMGTVMVKQWFWDTPFAECTATQHFDGPKNGPGFEYTYNPPKGWVDTKNEQPFVVSQHF